MLSVFTSQMNETQNHMAWLPQPAVVWTDSLNDLWDMAALPWLAWRMLFSSYDKRRGAKSGHEPLSLMTAESAGNFSCAATRNDCNVNTDAGMSCHSPISSWWQERETHSSSLYISGFSFYFGLRHSQYAGCCDDWEHFRTSLKSFDAWEGVRVKGHKNSSDGKYQNSVCRAGSVAQGVWWGQWKSLVSHYVCASSCF